MGRSPQTHNMGQIMDSPQYVQVEVADMTDAQYIVYGD